MSVFDFVDEVDRAKRPANPEKNSGRGGLVRREGIVVRIREASVLFFDDNGQKELFIPLSQVKDWWFTSSGDKRNLRICDLELDDEITLVFPRWLAVKEGIA